MKIHLALTYLIVAGTSSITYAQDFRKHDSLLTIYVNGLAKEARMPIAEIQKQERDSALKIIHQLTDYSKMRPKKDMDGKDVYPMDSVRLSFFLRERIRPEFLK